MSGTIKIDVEAAEKEIQKLTEAITAFEPFTQQFTKKTKAKLNGFNSDFTERLKGILENMGNDTGPELLVEIKTYKNNVKSAVRSFKTADEEISTVIGDAAV